MFSAKVKARTGRETATMSAGYWRINPVALISAAVALISVFLPWWGIAWPVGVGAVAYRRWDLWSPPSAGVIRNVGHAMDSSAANIAQTFAYSSVLVLLLVLVVASLALAGSLTMNRTLLTIGLALSILTPIVYLAGVSYLTSQYCIMPLPSSCATGIVGSALTIENLRFTWGFETGFYAFIATIIVLGLGLYMNTSLARTVMTHRAEVIVQANQPAKYTYGPLDDWSV